MIERCTVNVDGRTYVLIEVEQRKAESLKLARLEREIIETKALLKGRQGHEGDTECPCGQYTIHR